MVPLPSRPSEDANRRLKPLLQQKFTWRSRCALAVVVVASSHLLPHWTCVLSLSSPATQDENAGTGVATRAQKRGGIGLPLQPPDTTRQNPDRTGSASRFGANVSVPSTSCTVHRCQLCPRVHVPGSAGDDTGELILGESRARLLMPAVERLSFNARHILAFLSQMKTIISL